MSDKVPYCEVCHITFPNWLGLALHVMASKAGHRKWKKWAAKVVARNTLRPEIPRRNPESPDHESTEYGEENRANAKRELSGDQKYANTVCPTCKKPSRSLIETEFINSEWAWRVNGRLFLTCPSCRRD